MAQVALITDTHKGARGDNIHVMRHQKKFYIEIFFPELEKRGIKTIYHLGDIVDRRRYINFLSAEMLKWFVMECHKRGIKLVVILGNHDCYYKNTNRVNAINIIFGETDLVEFYEEATEIDIDGLKVMCVPWITPENYEDTMTKLNDTKAEVVFGHLEFKGFEMYKGSPNEHGMDTKPFKKFDQVFSGHFHHKSTKGNITYLGAPYEMKWQDWNDLRGFHIYDTDTRKLEHVKNYFHLFYKVIYDDTEGDPLDKDYSHLKDCYVKIVVKEKTNEYTYDQFVDKIEEVGPIEVQVVEDFQLDMKEESSLIEDVTDTLEIVTRSVEDVEFNQHEALTALMKDLYERAQELSR